jgi:hypothetical protein
MTAHHTSLSRSSRRPRRGVATIELALCLPFMMMLLMVIFTLGSFWQTHMGTTITARYNAWVGKDEPWAPDARHTEERLPVDGFESVGTILGPKPLLPAERGLLHAEVVNSIPIYCASMKGLIPDAHAQHYVLAGCWDYRNIPFENDRHKHRPLHCGKKYRYLNVLTTKPVNMDSFLVLLFGGLF